MAEVESSVSYHTDDIGEATTAAAPALSASERARCERNRLRARALRDARLAANPPTEAPAPAPTNAPLPHKRGPIDSGGGFLLEVEEVAAAPAPLAQPPAPLQPHQQPPCLECSRLIATSYLLDTFAYEVCDSCRDEEGAHSLVTRTEARTEFLLKECDLDAREPPLRCVRRPNPHRGGHDMRLYLRAQVERRALDVWGSAEALEEERAVRGLKRARLRAGQERRRLRALRMDVRSSLYTKPREEHRCRWGSETYDASTDTYSRACLDCGHTETYEKM